MDRKRSFESAGGTAPPPAKHVRIPQGEIKDEDEEGQSTPILQLQRAQLAAKIADQERELDWARNRIEELQYMVGALDAVPMSANYCMAACIEELGLSLLRTGLTPEDVENGPAVDSFPIAATLLDEELVSNESLKEQPKTLKRLTAHIVVQLENLRDRKPRCKENDGASTDQNGKRQEERAVSSDERMFVEEVRARHRMVSDQLERYADRDKQNAVASATLRDELDDLRALLDIRRRRIVMLEMTVRQLQKQPGDVAIAGAVASAVATQDLPMEHPSAPASNGDSGSLFQDGQPEPAHGSDSTPGFGQGHTLGTLCPIDDPARGEGKVMETSQSSNPHAATAQPSALVKSNGVDVTSLQKLADDRLQELVVVLEEKKQLFADVTALRRELDLRDEGVPSIKVITSSPIFQILEAELQQFYSKERTWEAERDAIAEERAQEKRDAQELLEETTLAFQKEIEELRKTADDLRRVAESAKMEKDKWVMTYEVRKMEANSAECLVKAAERRASMSESFRDKLKASNTALLAENHDLRNRVQHSELRTIGASTLPEAAEIVARLEKDLSDQQTKSASFIEEIESLSVMFGELEAENARLGKLLAEKESVLSKVMNEKLRGRQQLATVKEETRALAQGREIDQEKIRNLTSQVSASKRAAAEAAAGASKAAEEVRILSQQLLEQRKIAEESTASFRTAVIDRDKIQKQLDSANAKEAEAQINEQTDRFKGHRLSEENEKLQRELEKAKAEVVEAKSKLHVGDTERDDIIQVLMKKLHCAVVTNQPKEVVLPRCGHMLSRQCVSQLVAARSRKCPLCGTAFTKEEIVPVYLN